MNRIYIAQKLFSVFEGFTVYNADGSVAYKVSTSPLALTKTLVVRNPSGLKVGELKKTMVALIPGWNLYINGKKIGELHRDLSLFGPKMTLTGMRWTIKGNLTGWDYSVYSGSRRLGRISRQLWHLTDHYAIDFDSADDELPLLLVVLGIDAMNEEANQSNSSSSQSD